MLVTHEIKEQIPYLQVVLKNVKDERLPTIFFVHGFTSAKEHNLHYAYYLAQRGFRVILPEAPMHGERSEQWTDAQLERSFWKIVLTIIKELDILAQQLRATDVIAEDRIGLAGTSMGGIVTFGALTQYDWIKVAVSLMGSPTYVQFAHSQLETLQQNNKKTEKDRQNSERLRQALAPYDLSKQPHKLNNRPLLIWHSETDDVVPFQPTYSFYKGAIEHYTDSEKITFIRDQESGHKVSRAGVLETVRWFERYL